MGVAASSSSSAAARLPSPRSPPSPSGIQTVSTVSPSASADQVALGAVHGAGGLHDLRQADLVASGGHCRPQLLGKDGDLIEGGHALLVQGVEELPAPVRLLPHADHELGQASEVHAEERFRCG